MPPTEYAVIVPKEVFLWGLSLLGLLAVWVVYSVHELKVAFGKMTAALEVRVEHADKAHARYDSYGSRIDLLERTLPPHLRR